MIDCYRDVGAVDAKVYVEQVTNLEGLRLPIAGVLAVINQDRLRENFLSCVTNTALDELLSPQSLEPEPCYGSGTFTSQGDTISYIYGATDRPLCQLMEQYFSGF